MSLNLNIDRAAGPGRPALRLEARVDRELNPADLGLLSVVKGSVSVPLKKLSDRHHALARLLASGTPEGEAALILGYDISRVSILKQSPAFQELLALYRREVDFEFSTVLEHMAGLSRDALLEIRERLEENPEDFATKDLLAIVNDMADRTGAPRQREVKQEINVNLGDRLAAARERARAHLRAQIEDAEVVEGQVLDMKT